MKFVVTDTLFNNLKKAEKELSTEVAFNKKSAGPNANEHDYDFSCKGLDLDVDLDDVANVFSNKIIQSASNIKVYADPTENADVNMIVLKYNNGKMPATSKSLNVAEVLKTVKSLIKLDKTGIAKRAEENQKTRKHISVLEAQMNI